MVQSILTIDRAKPEMVPTDKMDFTEKLKEHLVKTQREIGFIIEQNRVSTVDYLTKHQE